MWELLQMITTGKTELDPARDKDVGMIELHWLKQKEMDELPSPRVLNTHLWFTQLPEDVTQKKTKLVFLCRNPKDVCVSWYVVHKEAPWYEYRGEFANWIQRFLDGNGRWQWQCQNQGQ
nr:hypothetical protein BaRGS_007811 [Batillaria attramentaria]